MTLPTSGMKGCDGCGNGLNSCSAQRTYHVQPSEASTSFDDQEAISQKIVSLKERLKDDPTKVDASELEQLAGSIALDSFSSLSRLNQFFLDHGIDRFLDLLAVLNTLNIRGHFCLWYFEFCQKRLMLDDQDMPFSPSNLNHILSLQEFLNEQACIFKAFHTNYQFPVYPKL